MVKCSIHQNIALAELPRGGLYCYKCKGKPSDVIKEIGEF